MPGVVKVVVRKNFVGVVAEKPWQAMQTADELKRDVDAGSRLAAAARLLRLICGQQPRATRCWSNSKDVDETIGVGRRPC